ncbi:hypothetical protein CTAYLR_008571 [Chrysophaeum taylorii]|uniref:Vacuolar protein sorting-associated protein 52 A n=1 Tax=Chrysophaeum taylorii TaxID=2483200 RepID=A0AAD7UF25_9STRA|nr:hypothetical protein CTAYLR_008571 [Chrysophaeum taylorii]
MMMIGDEEDVAAELASDLATLEKEEFVRDALQQGVPLREYSKKVERELREVEAASVRDYVRQSSQVADLHGEMTKCDEILGKMQDMLVGFESDLGSVSSEIRQLQKESRKMSIKLRNKKAAEAKLSSFLASWAFPPDMPSILCDGEVDETFLDQVEMLDARLSFRRKKHAAKSVAEVGPALDKLKLKACARSRDYLIERISELRRLQSIEVQRTRLARFAPLFAFLERHAPEAASEVREFYVESMSKALQSLFKTYNAALMKFDLEVANKFDLVAVDESSVRSTFTSRVSLSKRGDGFSLGDRVDVLRRIDAPPIITHVALAEDRRYPFEELFRSALRHLTDASRAETDFASAFFRADLVPRIFGKASAAALEHLENKLFQCHDAVGLLLVAKLVSIGRDDAPRLASFFDHCDALLKPRLSAIFQANIESARRADPARLGVNGVMPHYVARRYAELAATVLALYPAGDDHGARRAIADLRGEILDLLKRVAASFKSDKDRLVFLVNNYDLILTIFHERRATGEEVLHFEAKLKKERELFVEAELLTCFSKLILFVKQAETSATTTNTDVVLVERLVRDFAATWKTAIDKIHRDILAYFANFLNGMEVLKQVLTQLLLYYTRFQKIVQKTWRRPPPFAKDLVPTASILDEIKKYSHSF